MRRFECQGRLLARLPARRWHSHSAHAFTPRHTDYYDFDLGDPNVEQVLGPPRVERTRIEAAARMIAERLFLHDSTNRALLEEELEQDGARYLKDYVDTRDAQPLAAHLSSSQVSNRLYGLLGPPAQARGRRSRQLLGDVARFMAAHQVVKLSDYHRMIRWLLNSSLADAAADVMDTLLMSRPSGFGTSTYTLCLELAVVRRDARRFGELVKRVKQQRNQWLALQHKFNAPDFNAKDPAVVKLLADGYLQFNRSNDLTYVMQHTQPLTPELLLVNMRASVKWHDVERAQWTLIKLQDLLLTSASPKGIKADAATMQLLELASKLEAVSDKAHELRRGLERPEAATVRA